MPANLQEWASLVACIGVVYFLVVAIRAAASIATWGDDD